MSKSVRSGNLATARASRSFPFSRRYTTNELRNKRKVVLACKRCFTWHESGASVCRHCRVMVEFHRFDSRIEALYAGQLRLAQRAGRIEDLQFHPKYTARVASQGGKDSWISWTPDGRYRTVETGVETVYDVKAKEAPLDSVFVLKRRIFSEILAAEVVVVWR